MARLSTLFYVNAPYHSFSISKQRGTVGFVRFFSLPFIRRSQFAVRSSHLHHLSLLNICCCVCFWYVWADGILDFRFESVFGLLFFRQPSDSYKWFGCYFHFISFHLMYWLLEPPVSIWLMHAAKIKFANRFLIFIFKIFFSWFPLFFPSFFSFLNKKSTYWIKIELNCPLASECCLGFAFNVRVASRCAHNSNTTQTKSKK